MDSIHNLRLMRGIDQKYQIMAVKISDQMYHFIQLVDSSQNI